MFTDAVTLYKHTRKARVDNWERSYYPRVMWKESTVKSINDDGVLNVGKTVEITIPSGECLRLDPTSNLNIVVLGNCPAVINADYSIADLQRDYKTAVVKSVDNNANRGLLKHWKLVCV